AASGMALDHAERRAEIFSCGLQEDLQNCDAGLAEERCQILRRLLEAVPDLPAATLQVRSCRASIDRDTYLSEVRKIQERILRGDCYQVNFSQRFILEGNWDAADLYLRLRANTPAPQMAFVNLGEACILSASPEVLLDIEGRKARSYPIKGTRPRGVTADVDRRLAEELLASPKDAAELLMIVDLVRNDLGRCCELGSIRVPVLKTLD